MLYFYKMTGRVVYILLVIFLFIAACAGSKMEDDDELVEKYRQRIGCNQYSSLRPAQGEFSDAVEKCKDKLKSVEPDKEIATALVYRSLNKDVLFIHLAVRDETKRIYSGANFLFDQKSEKVLGYYKCY